MKNNLFPTQHDYYAHSSNRYSHDGEDFETFDDFYNEYHDVDIDYNLVFRFDINEDEDTGLFRMQIIIIQQRRGVYFPIQIKSVTKEDEPKITEFMKPHFEKLITNWQPISGQFLETQK